MKRKYFLIILVLTGFVSCSGSGVSYCLCKEGATRCSGNNLEICSDFEEWALKTECSFLGGECVTEGKNSYCANMENDGEFPDGYVTEWDETEDDSFEEQDDDYIAPDNASDDSEDFDDYDYINDETDEDPNDDDLDEYEDTDFSDEDEITAVCGNEILEFGEVCEKGDLKDCIEIDSDKYSGGKAFCLDDCSGFNTVTCSEK